MQYAPRRHFQFVLVTCAKLCICRETQALIYETVSIVELYEFDTKITYITTGCTCTVTSKNISEICQII
jgi:hypothetical protein